MIKTSHVVIAEFNRWRHSLFFQEALQNIWQKVKIKHEDFNNSNSYRARRGDLSSSHMLCPFQPYEEEIFILHRGKLRHKFKVEGPDSTYIVTVIGIE